MQVRFANLCSRERVERALIAVSCYAAYSLVRILVSRATSFQLVIPEQAGSLLNS
jgi:hypothetical protein